MNELLTEPEAAKVLKVCTRTLRKARKAGRLRYVLIEGSIRYTPSDIEHYIESCRQVADPPMRRPPTRSARVSRGNIVPFSAR